MSDTTQTTQTKQADTNNTQAAVAILALALDNLALAYLAGTNSPRTSLSTHQQAMSRMRENSLLISKYAQKVLS